MKSELLIVIPAYNEEENIENVVTFIKNKYSQYDYIVVNDGSKDNTLKILKEIANTDKNVHYISFSRNFGKEAAMYGRSKIG